MSCFPPFSIRIKRFALLSFLLSGAAFPCFGYAAVLGETPPVSDQVDFLAEQINYDEKNQIIVASGNVEITQEGRVVKAKTVTYHLLNEAVEAEGDVVMMEPSGDVHFADRVELKDRFKNGYVKKLRSVLADGSRFTAEEGHRENAERIVMTDATYTPCEECKADPEKAPLWQFRAGKVTHDTTDHTITYNDATFEVGGFPIAYTPYFSHPDGTIHQKSGVLPPTFSSNSQMGLSVNTRYYWAISPSEDATLGARLFTKETPMAFGEYRKRYDDAELELDASATSSSRKDTVGEETITKGDEFRGHLFGKGLWNIDEKWRAGFRTQLTTDDQYLRQYDLSSESVLDNEVYAERFSGRNYLVGRAMAFQDVRVSDRSADQPNILPDIRSNMLGQPNDLLGGRWSLDLSALGLTRKGNGQDVLRGSATAGWERRDVASFGSVNTLTAALRGDAYKAFNYDEDMSGDSSSDVSTRFYPYVQDVLSYPLVRDFDAFQSVIEPTIALTAASNVDNNSNIPNEDSQDVQIDALNIFSPNRFPGLDRVEDRVHATFGGRAGVYAPDGSEAEIFLGQSFRLNNSDNPFPEGSGLSGQESDFVGQIMADYQRKFGLDYRFQLGADSFESERHELSAYAGWEKISLSATYLYARALEGTDLDQSREQLYQDITYDFVENWRMRESSRYDFGDLSGFRNVLFGVDYFAQCATISTTAKRSFAFEETGADATEVMVRIGLKNLGEFGTGD